MNGVYTNSAVINSADFNSIGAGQGHYLGTCGTLQKSTASLGQLEDSFGGLNNNGGHRGLWNNYHRKELWAGVIDTATSWTPGSQWGSVHTTLANNVTLVIGLEEDALYGIAKNIFSSTTPGHEDNGISPNDVVSAQNLPGNINNAMIGQLFGDESATAGNDTVAHFVGQIGIGFHPLFWVEKAGGGTPVSYGSFGAGNQITIQTGMFIRMVG